MLGAIDQIVDDFACTLAFVDHASNLSAQIRALFVITVLCGFTKRARAHGLEFLGICARRLALGIRVSEGALEGANRMPRRAAGRTRRRVARLEHQLFVLLRYGALVCDQKACSHLHAGGTEHKGGRHTAAIGDAASRNHGNIDRIDNLRDKGHRRSLANMAARFGALGNHGSGSTTRHEACQRHRGNDRDDLDARLVPRLHVLGGIAGTRHDDRHPLVNHDPRDLVGKRAHEHDVDAKGLIRPGAQLMNLVAQPVGVGVHGRDNP